MKPTSSSTWGDSAWVHTQHNWPGKSGEMDSKAYLEVRSRRHLAMISLLFVDEYSDSTSELFLASARAGRRAIEPIQKSRENASARSIR